jgi:hypothetical protein
MRRPPNCETVNKTETSASAVCPTDLGYTNNIIQQRRQIYDKQISAKHNIYFSIHTHSGWAQGFWQKKIKVKND